MTSAKDHTISEFSLNKFSLLRITKPKLCCVGR